jgi:hypothetical protein
MSRILLHSLAVLGLTLASCSMPSSFPFFGDDDAEAAATARNEAPFEVRETTPPHKGGLAATGDGFAKYFLNHDRYSPYSYGQGSTMDSLWGWWRSDRKDFGGSTERPATFTPNYDAGPSLLDSASKYGLNRDKNNPYNR